MTRKAELLDPKDVAEIDVVPFNFTRAMTAGETIASAVVTCTVSEGDDPTPQAMLLQAAQLSGKTVLQQVGGGVAGAVYLLRCEAVFSSGRKLALAGVLPVLRLKP